MPLSLHREMHTRSGASRMHPTGPVRAVHTKPQTLGWLEVSVSEFVQLLARHEAGEINLLAMPEMAGDDIDDDAEVEADGEATDPELVIQSARIKSDTHLARVLRCFGKNPITQHQISEATGLTVKQVKSAMDHSRYLFAIVDDGRKEHKLWRLKRAKLP